jgi:hypothetical protein
MNLDRGEKNGIENKGVWEIKDGKSASGGKYIVTAAAKTKNTPTVQRQHKISIQC